jgi:hypothetical protein
MKEKKFKHPSINFGYLMEPFAENWPKKIKILLEI